MKYAIASAAVLAGFASAAPAAEPVADKPANYGSYPKLPGGYGKYDNYGSYDKQNYGAYGSYGQYNGHPAPPKSKPAATPSVSVGEPVYRTPTPSVKLGDPVYRTPTPSVKLGDPVYRTPTPSKPAATPTGTPTARFAVTDFTERRPNGAQNPPNSVTFNIAATNGGTLNFECGPYDPATNAFGSFTNGTVYSCGENSLFSFAYDDGVDGANNTLYLWQSITPDNTIGGSTSFADPICRAGGAGRDDLVCFVPSQAGNLTIDMYSLSS